MKKGLLATTALVGAGALMAGAAGAAEAPTWKLGGTLNFQFYWVDSDFSDVEDNTWNIDTTINGATDGTKLDVTINGFRAANTGQETRQDHDWYFGVDEAELALKVDGVADNGLKYGFKIEIQVNTSDGTVADEARIQLAGSWGTLQLGDEDGAEDTMNYGGESLMGGTGGFDGDTGDYLFRAGTITDFMIETKPDMADLFNGIHSDFNAAAPSFPGIAGDTSDATKITYYSPRFSGFQVGASITPTPNTGDNFKKDGDWENAIGLGANYDNTFGSLRIRASAVYAANTSTDPLVEDASSFQVGGIVGFGPFSIGANYGDNGESGNPAVWDVVATEWVQPGWTSYFWDVAAGFETGPMYFSAGYFVGVRDVGYLGESTYEHIALTADYKIAPGLSAYAEINLISDELLDVLGTASELSEDEFSFSNDTTAFILGIKASF